VTVVYLLLPFFRRRFQGIDQATDGLEASPEGRLLPSPVICFAISGWTRTSPMPLNPTECLNPQVSPALTEKLGDPMPGLPRAIGAKD
jgi:hypothetical protein